MARLRRVHLVPLAVLVLAAGLPAAASAASTSYSITDLGSLGGASLGSGINATGQVTGYSYLSTLVPTPECPPVYGNTKKTCVEHPWHAFAYSKGQMTDLGTVGGGDFSTGAAINLSGQVVGESSTKNGGADAFVWNGQKMTDLGQLAPLNGSSSAADGINDSGQVVGYYGSGNTDHAFLYSNGAMTNLPEPSFNTSASCEANAINNGGQVAGSCQDTSGNTHLVMWQNGTITDLGTLGTPGNYTFTQAVSINNKGQIAGTAFTTGVGTNEGFLYNNGTITNLGSFLPASINDNGVMVGGPSIDTGGTIQNLNNLIPSGSGYQIQNATAINDNGQVVANTTNGHTLLLTPN